MNKWAVFCENTKIRGGFDTQMNAYWHMVKLFAFLMPDKRATLSVRKDN